MTTIANSKPEAALGRKLRCVQVLWDTRRQNGGAARFVRDIARVMSDRGHNATVMTRYPEDLPAAWRASDGSYCPRVRVMGAGRLPGKALPPGYVRRLRDALINADVVHLHSPWMVCNWQIAALLKTNNIPYVVSLHSSLGAWSMSKGTLKKRVALSLHARRFLEAASCVHFSTERGRDVSIRWIPGAADKAVVAPCFVDLSPYTRLPPPDLARNLFPQLGGRGPRVLFMGRLRRVKGIEVLIDTAAKLREAGTVIQLIIAGAGERRYREQLERRAHEAGVGSQVVFPGMVWGQQKLALYQMADVLVMPSYGETFGLALVEALACGLPVVTTHGTDIWPELREAGALLAPRTADGFAAALSELIADPVSARRRGRGGQQYVNRWLSTDALLDDYQRIYERAMTIVSPKSEASRTTTRAT